MSTAKANSPKRANNENRVVIGSNRLCEMAKSWVIHNREGSGHTVILR